MNFFKLKWNFSFETFFQVYYNGHHGDCWKTFLIGNVDPLGRHLVKVTEECLNKGIEVCGLNVPFKEIGAAIETHALENGLEVIREFIGHGIGSYFHGLPEILHYRMLLFLYVHFKIFINFPNFHQFLNVRFRFFNLINLFFLSNYLHFSNQFCYFWNSFFFSNLFFL